MAAAESGSQLDRQIRLRQLFTLAIGSMIGIGWILVLGSWVSTAGSIGAILGFAGGGLMVILIGLCYAEAATMFPVAGGEVAYSYEMFGLRWSFLTGWLLALTYISFVQFLAISVGWVLNTLIPGIQGPALYSILGDEVYLGSLIIGLLLMIVITWANYRGVKTAMRFQEVMTYSLFIITIIFICGCLVNGDVSNLNPVFIIDKQGSIIHGILAVMITAPVWFGGFDIIPQAMEEKVEAASSHLVARVIVLSIIGGLIFYCLVILASSLALPRDLLLDAELPVSSAANAAFKSPLAGHVILVAGLLGLLTSWNAVFFAVTRVIYCLGRARMIPAYFGKVDATHRTPVNAILFVCVIGTLGTFLGRSALLPIISFAAATFAFVFFMVCLGIIVLRYTRPQHPRPYRVPGGLFIPVMAMASSLFMIVVAAYNMYSEAEGAFPTEWSVMTGWLLLGVLFWSVESKARNTISETNRRQLIFAALPSKT